MTAPPASPGIKPPRSWARPLGDPLAWSAVDKSLLVVAIMLPGIAVLALIGHLFNGWIYVPQAATGERLRALIDRLTLAGAGVWLALLAAGLVLRTRQPGSRVFMWLTVTLYSITVTLFICMSGSFHSPGWILVIGGVVVGLLLFGRAVTLFGLALFVAVFATIQVAGEAGWLGELGVVTRPPAPIGPEWRWWMARMAASTALFGGATIWLVFYVTGLLREREQRLDHMSKTDALTMVANRRHFLELLDRELARARRYSTPLSCVMIDLDHFKGVNDGHGHLIGDQVLVAVADALRRSIRESDMVARYGGEEFVLLLPSTDLTGARDLAERCRAVIAATQVAGRQGLLSVTASMGVASLPPATDMDTLLSAADEALYQAKDGGRDRVVVSDRKAA
ncbi:MAG TPA: GGDEF domain-containing protein [Kofleriaceae bacterium]|nr:GGDEF domain-containing protein [Kofleriaceae bacterium]